MKKYALLLSVFVVSCAHHKDVRPGADGENRVLTTAAEAEAASRDAIAQAKHYCEQFKKAPVIISEKVSYTGEMDENTRKTLKKASKAAVIIGGAASRPGDVGTVMTSGKDYKADVIFKCQ